MTIQLNFYAQSTAQEFDQNATVLINNKKRKREKEEGTWEGERWEGRERKICKNTITLSLRCQFRINLEFG